MIELKPIVSSNISEAGYDPGSLTFDVKFKSGKLYRYSDVPQHVYDDFLASTSPGGYFAAHIRSNYEWVLVEAPKPEDKEEDEQ